MWFLLNLINTILKYFAYFWFLRYNPGDVVMIAPQNSQKSVEEFATHMKLELETCITIDQNDMGNDIMSIKLHVYNQVTLGPLTVTEYGI